MAMAFSEGNHEGMNRNGSDKDTLYMLSGAALMLFGAGLILSNPTVRKYLGQVGVGSLLTAAIPDVDRYLKLRNM
ncbi:MAG: hypothetical protein WA437_19045 [Candidatus Sulfotelmatobacter sp.]